MSTTSSVSGEKPAFKQSALVQQLSIHQLSMRKVCRFFSVPEESVDLLDVIGRIVLLYNNTKAQRFPYLPVVQHAETPPFQMTAYAQKTEVTSGLARWVERLEGDTDLTTRKVDYIFFFYRRFEQEETAVNEIFALSSGQAWRVVQKYSDFRFPPKLARRLCDPQVMSSRNRPLVGRVLAYSEILKEGAVVSDTDALDKLFTRMKFPFRRDASVFSLSFFQNQQGKALQRGMAAEFGLGLVRLSKRVTPEDYVEILHHFSAISRKEMTYHFPKKKEEEVDSEEFDFLEYVHPVDFSLVPGLNKALRKYIYQTVVGGKEFPPLDFCHRNLSEYFHGDNHELHYGDTIWDCPYPFSAARMVNLLKSVPALATAPDQETFDREIEKVRVSFEFGGRKEAGLFVEFLEGEVRATSGDSYWRLRGMWYEVRADYLSLIHQEFGQMLGKTLLDPKDPVSLLHKWPSPEDKEKARKQLIADHKKACKEKKCTHRVKYDTEAEYNQSYLSKDNFLLGDKICPQGIELFDVLRWTKDCVYLYHVKEGFGQKTRDACSQIYQSARQLHTLRQKGASNIVKQFYAMAAQSDAKDPYRKAVKKKMVALGEKGFYELFQKKVVFVYAFVDDAKKPRQLARDKGLKTRITPADLAGAHKKFKKLDKKLFAQLVQHQYLTAKGHLTSKFFSASGQTFTLPMLTVDVQRKNLYQCLSKFTTQFDSTIAKLELLRVQQEVERLGFKLLISQLSRTDEVEDDTETSDAEGPTAPAEGADLSEADEEELAAQRGDIGQGDDFTHNEQTFHICETEGDGACGLHAILGAKKKGKYIYPDESPNAAVRKRYVQTLRGRFQEVQEAYAVCMVNLLKDFLGKNDSIFVKQVFGKVPQVVDLRKKLLAVDNSKKTLTQKQTEIFTQLAESEEEDVQEKLEAVLKVSLSSLQDDEANRNRIFGNNLREVLEALEELEDDNLSQNQESLQKLEAERDDILRTFVLTPPVVEAYCTACQGLDYYFSDAELALAAVLFDKQIHLYAHRISDQVFDPTSYGKEGNDEIVIFHKGIHYSRCIERQESESDA